MNWTMAGALASMTILGGGTAFLCIILTRLLRYRRADLSACQPDLPVQFDPVRYEVMTRLMAEEDFEFLASQPGYSRSIGARLRRERRRIFRMYLHALAADFYSMHAAARKIVADSPEHDADLVGMLIHCQLIFWRRMFMVELRLLAPGAPLPKLDVAALLQPMESMRHTYRISVFSGS